MRTDSLEVARNPGALAGLGSERFEIGLREARLVCDKANCVRTLLLVLGEAGGPRFCPPKRRCGVCRLLLCAAHVVCRGWRTIRPIGPWPPGRTDGTRWGVRRNESLSRALSPRVEAPLRALSSKVEFIHRR